MPVSYRRLRKTVKDGRHRERHSKTMPGEVAGRRREVGSERKRYDKR